MSSAELRRGRGVGVRAVGRALALDDQPFFYLGDTAWSAFADASVDEWSYYLDYRRRQGFNAVQVSLLPILHDRSLNPDSNPAFDIDQVQEHSRWQFNDRYFSRAARMVDEAAQQGIVCTLVVVWCSYVAGTWASARAPQFVMSNEVLSDYMARCRELLLRPNVVLVASGDSGFVAPEEEPFYAELIAGMRTVNPQAVIGCHLQPRALLPASLDKLVDVLMYQSGHHFEEQSLGWRLAQYYSACPPPRPTIDMEPCYEGHALGGRKRRYRAEDVRRVVWQSVVAGATAGTGYAAHGVWSWHRTGSTFTNPQFSGEPADWREALSFAGARDVAVCRRVMEAEHLVGAENVLHGMVTAVPVVQGVDAHQEGDDDVLVATHGQQGPGGMAYLAPGQEARLPVAVSEISEIRAIDLRTRAPAEVAARGSAHRETFVTAGPASGDVVIVWK